MHPEDPKPPSSPSFPLTKLKSFIDLDFDTLKETHEFFMEPWGGKDKGLTKSQFCEVIKKTIGRQFTNNEIESLFEKTNANCTQRICWKDFIGCITMVLQYHNYLEETALKTPIFRPEVKFISDIHRNPIVAICFVPTLRLQSLAIDYSCGRYYMLGREGLISMWTLNMKLSGYRWIGSDGRSSLPKYYIDMTVLYPSTLIAVISTERCIAIWEMHSDGISLKYTITALSNCPTCLDYWADLTSRTRNLLFWGDTAGDVHCLEFNVNHKEGLFIRSETKENLVRVHYTDLLRGKISGVRLIKMAAIHKGWVIKIRYLPKWDAFISCSQTNINSLFYGDFHGKREYYSCRTSVLCFEYSVQLNIVVTGCLNATVFVWNFFVKQTPIFRLRGHHSPVIAVAIREATRHVISVDTGHAVNVYNLLNQQCIQRFGRLSMTALGGLPTTSHYYNPARNELTMASTTIAWALPVPVFDVRSDYSEICSHDYPLVGVIYSSEFCKIISACRGGFITVWDVYTGTSILQFRHYSRRTPPKEVEYESDCNKLELTAIVMDQTGRRIVTGATDGTINLWNFSGGILIKNYSLPEAVVISAIVNIKELLFITGWDKRIYITNLESKRVEDSIEFLRPMHTEDILCMTLVEPGLLATASYDGDVIVIKRDTGNVIFKLNACLSRYPINSHNLAKKKGLKKRNEEEEDESCADVFDVLTGRYVTREESDAQTETFENSVDAMLFLHTRQPNDERTATLITAGNEGWIRAWSLHNKGGLLGQFAATEQVGEMVLAMTTDPQNELLITGDTRGYVRVWDLLLYCNREAESISETELEARDDAFHKKFLFLRSSFLKDKIAEGKYNRHKRPPPMASKPELTLKIPRLLNVFRAHAFPITCITYVADRELIITGDQGKAVRIWLLSGRYIGTCGEPWQSLISPQQKMVQLRNLPSELRHCLSARTFKVIQVGAKHLLWDKAIRLVKQHLRGRQYKEKVSGKEKKEEKTKSSESLDQEWRNPRRSSILGSTYKPNLHYKPRPAIFTQNNIKKFPAFHTLPIYDIQDIQKISKPRLTYRQDVHQTMIPLLAKAKSCFKKSRTVALNKTNNAKLPPIGLKKHRISPSISDQVFEGLSSHSGTSSHLPSIDDRSDDGKAGI